MTKVKVGDEVVILSGKDKGKVSRVIERLPKSGKVVVEDVNISKRHVKAHKRGQESGIIEREAPLPLSKVMLVCPRCGKRTRVGIKTTAPETGEREKLRICKRCGEVID